MAAVGLGLVLAAVGSLIAHFTGLSEIDELGREIYPAIPRGWQFQLVGQLIAVGGVLVAIAGIALAFLYDREMTWARAAIGAALFTGLMIIVFGVIPNQWLTLTQAVWEWTPQKTLFTVPKPLVLNNEVSISAAAAKDIISGTYAVVALGVIAVAMVKWQDYQKQRASGPPPQEVSGYGRPLTKVER
jgi:hypothetical protein